MTKKVAVRVCVGGACVCVHEEHGWRGEHLCWRWCVCVCVRRDHVSFSTCDTNMCLSNCEQVCACACV